MTKKEKLKLFNDIRKTNDKFDKATKAEKREMIAKDILKYLSQDLIKAQAGDYVNFDLEKAQEKKQAQDALPEINECLFAH